MPASRTSTPSHLVTPLLCKFAIRIEEVAIALGDLQLTPLPAAQPDTIFPFLGHTALPHGCTILLRPRTAFVLGKASAVRMRLAGVALHPSAFSHAVMPVSRMSTLPRNVTALLFPLARRIEVVAIARGDLTAPPTALPGAMFPFAHTTLPHRLTIPMRPRSVFVPEFAPADRPKPRGQGLGG